MVILHKGKLSNLLGLLCVTSSALAFAPPASPTSNSHNLLTNAPYANAQRAPLRKYQPLTVVNQSSSSSSNVEGLEQKPMVTNTVIVGAGPAGLLTGIMLAKKFPLQKIQIYDRLTAPPSPTDEAIWGDIAKFYLIGLGSRGQGALQHYGVWDDVEAVCTTVMGRMDWSPENDSEEGVENIFTNRKVNTQVLPRDKLVGVLHQVVTERYADQIELNYGFEVTPEDFGEDGNGDGVTMRVSRCETMASKRDNPVTGAKSSVEGEDVLCDVEDGASFLVQSNLLIAADGTSRTIANAMEDADNTLYQSKNRLQKLFGARPFRVKRYVDDNRRIYKTVPMKIPAEWRPDLNYSARTKGGRINYDALPANRNGNYCGVLLMKEDDEFAAADSDPQKFRNLLDEALPQFSSLLDDETVASVAQKPPSFLPSFRYAGPRLNQGDHTLILGDSAHTVKPYFGLGANSALEDVKVLEEAIDSTNTMVEAVHEFSKRRASESEALVKISRELDRPGKLGFITFVLPLILDSIFHGKFPKIFSPNTISMLQKDEITFRDVQRIKRRDRIGQVALLGSGASGLILGGKTAISYLSKVTGRKGTSVFAGIVWLGMAATLAKELVFYLNPNIAPADVINKTDGKVKVVEEGSKENFLLEK